MITDPATEPVHRTLGALAEKCHAYAKALHYRELEFQSRKLEHGNLSFRPASGSTQYLQHQSMITKPSS